MNFYSYVKHYLKVGGVKDKKEVFLLVREGRMWSPFLFVQVKLEKLLLSRWGAGGPRKSAASVRLFKIRDSLKVLSTLEQVQELIYLVLDFWITS